MYTLKLQDINEVVLNGVKYHRPNGKLFCLQEFPLRDFKGVELVETAVVVTDGAPEPVLVDFPNPMQVFTVRKSCMTPGFPKCLAWYLGDDLNGIHHHADNSRFLSIDTTPGNFHNGTIIAADPLIVRIALNVATSEDNNPVWRNDGIFQFLRTWEDIDELTGARH